MDTGRFTVTFRPNDIPYEWILETSDTYLLDEWHFVCVGHNGNEPVIFVDGKIAEYNFDQENLTDQSYYFDDYGEPTNIELGAQRSNDNDWTDRFMEGKLDDIRIYNRALSESEIQALYHENGWNR